jgi:hypothetical protein
MREKDNYMLLKSGCLDTSEAPKDKEIYYRCLECGDIIVSIPRDNIGCPCGNIFIDVDYFRLAVRNLSKFEVVKKVTTQLEGIL